MTESAGRKPEIVVTRQWAVAETGYVFLSGTVEGLRHPATLRLLQDEETLSEWPVPKSGTGSEKRAMERLSPAELNSRKKSACPSSEGRTSSRRNRSRFVRIPTFEEPFKISDEATSSNDSVRTAPHARMRPPPSLLFKRAAFRWFANA